MIETNLLARTRYQFMKEVGSPLLMTFLENRKPKKIRQQHPNFGPALVCSDRLKRIMTRHYFLARYSERAMPVAWTASGAPVELLRCFGFYTVYPENHGALCGAKKIGDRMCVVAEDHGYSQDICSYARIDFGHLFSKKTPAGRLPKPDLLICSNNICMTVQYWYKALAHYLKVPLIIFDTPFVFADEQSPIDLTYMVDQFKDMIKTLEQLTGIAFDLKRFERIITLSKASSLAWGAILDTMKAKPAPMSIFDAFGHMAPIVSLRGLDVTRQYYEVLLAELKDRVAKGIGGLINERKRLIWDNIAIWYKIFEFANLFADHGFNFVAATYTNAWAETSKMIEVDHPFEAMARAYSLVILNNNLAYRYRLIERLIGDFSVDGAVIHSVRSCKPYSIGQYDIKRLFLERLRVPSVVIEADMTDQRAYSEEQTRTRLSAFFETLA